MDTMDSIAHNELPELTEADVLAELRAVLDHRYGSVEIIVRDGYIYTIHQNRTRQGKKPLHLRTYDRERV